MIHHTFPSGSRARLAFRLILPDADFEIHEPAELITYLDRLAGRLRRTAVRS